MTMLTLLSDKDISQLQAYTTEMLGITENIHLIISQAQTIDIGAEQAVRTPGVRTSQKAVRVSDTSASHGKSHASSRKGRRGVSVLTASKVADIKRQLLGGGKTVAALAQEYRVHPTTINCIKWNKTWKEVQPAAVAVKPLEIVETRK